MPKKGPRMSCLNSGERERERGKRVECWYCVELARVQFLYVFFFFFVSESLCYFDQRGKGGNFFSGGLLREKIDIL